jgi:pimeloyl-ACP methyl ester carboxylesterase
VVLDPSWLAGCGAAGLPLAGAFPLSGQMASHFNYRASIGHPAWRPLIDRFAPLWHVRPDAPPLLLIAGEHDMPCRVEENRYLLAALREVGHRQAACHIIPGRDHGTISSGMGDPADPVTRLFHDFLRALPTADSAR